MKDNFWGRLATLANVKDEIDIDAANASIRKNIHFRGMTIFILACAIIIASVGLNLNSIPVIIGAMLISPVMGPILGFGLSLAENDTDLLRESLKNLLIMVVISIVASAIYFLLSPLSPDQKTELLARTNPTIYDVLIALFGGAAGMFETSRKEKGTVLPGVAIATALMPPLCTIGYGIAHLEPRFIFGAFYLFIINSIFIALATFLVAKYLRFPTSTARDPERRKKNSRIVGVIMLIIVVPSFVSAVRMIHQTDFNRKVETLVSKDKAIGRSYIFNYEVGREGKSNVVDIYFAGETLSDTDKENFLLDAENLGLDRKLLRLHEDASVRTGVDSELMKNVYENSSKQQQALQNTIDSLQRELNRYTSKDIPTELIATELAVQYDGIVSVTLARGQDFSPENGKGSEKIVSLLTVDRTLPAETVVKITEWLKVRLQNPNVTVMQVRQSKAAAIGNQLKASESGAQTKAAGSGNQVSAAESESQAKTEPLADVRRDTSRMTE